MATTQKEQAQARVEQIQAFRREVQSLNDDGVLALEAEQQQAIEDYHQALIGQFKQTHDIDRSAQEKQLSWGMRITSFLGALTLGATLFYAVEYFFGRLPTSLQVVLLVLLPLLGYRASLYLYRRETSGYFANLAAMLTFAAFVMNLSTLGTIFNITPSDRAILAWGILGLMLAYQINSRLLLTMAIMSVAAYLSARMGSFMGVYWIHFGEWPENFFIPGLLFFLLPSIIEHRAHPQFANLYRTLALIGVFLPMLILANWGRASYMDFDADSIEVFYQLAGFVLAGACIFMGIRRGWVPVVHTANVFFVIFLYTRFVDWWWDDMPKVVFFLLMSLIAIGLLLGLRRIRNYMQVEVAQ